MAKFVTIGYGDQAGYDRTARAGRDAAHEHDARLKDAGGLIGIAGKPVQVRNPDASGVQTLGVAYGMYEFWPYRTSAEGQMLYETATEFAAPISVKVLTGENNATIRFQAR